MSWRRNSWVGRVVAPGAVLLAVLSLGGCSNATSGDVVVRVGGRSIEKATFDHWMSVMAPDRIVPRPPDYKTCIARLRATSPRSATGSKVATTRQASECRSRFEMLKRRVLHFLISSEWLIGEATDRGLKLPISGGAQASQLTSDSRLRTDDESAAMRIREQVIAASAHAARAEIAAFYKHNERRFVAEEERDAEVVRTRSRAAALAAKAEISSGVRFAAVARRRSVDAVGKTNGGLVPGIVPSQEDSVLRPAVFSARPHTLVGPVRLEPGRYYLFEILSVRPGRHVTLAQFERTRTPELQRRAVARFFDSWREKWTAKTDCNAGYVVAECRQYHSAATSLPNPFA